MTITRFPVSGTLAQMQQYVETVKAERDTLVKQFTNAVATVEPIHIKLNTFKDKFGYHIGATLKMGKKTVRKYNYAYTCLTDLDRIMQTKLNARFKQPETV